MSLAKLKLRHRNDWVIDITSPWDEYTKQAAWEFDTEAEARAKIESLVKKELGTLDEPAPTA